MMIIFFIVVLFDAVLKCMLNAFLFENNVRTTVFHEEETYTFMKIPPPSHLNHHTPEKEK